MHSEPMHSEPMKLESMYSEPKAPEPDALPSSPSSCTISRVAATLNSTNLARSRSLLAVVGICAALFTACGSITSAKSRLQSVVGTPANRLLPWFGAPSRVVERGDTEYLLYEWVIENVELVTTRRSNSAINPDRDTRVDAVCKLAFEIRDRTIVAVEVRGRTTKNGLYDGPCARLVLARISDSNEGN